MPEIRGQRLAKNTEYYRVGRAHATSAAMAILFLVLPVIVVKLISSNPCRDLECKEPPKRF